MAPFPLRDFFVNDNTEFLGYQTPISSTSEELKATLLIQLSDQGTADGHFRISLAGNVLIQASVKASDILDIPEAEGVFFFAQCNAEEVHLQLDSTTSAFSDLLDGLLDNSILTLNEQCQQIPAEELRLALSAAHQQGRPVGASFRWAIAVGVNKLLTIQLQALPVPERFLKPAYRQDNIPTMLMFSLPLQATMGDGQGFQGPYPVVFANTPAAARTALNQDPERAKMEFQKVICRLLHMEYVTLEEARAFLRKHRNARGVPAFNNVPDQAAAGHVPGSCHPPAKKQRVITEPVNPEQDAGGKSLCILTQVYQTGPGVRVLRVQIRYIRSSEGDTADTHTLVHTNSNNR